jgi:glyceraldehyde-3-phosphate dehydrogenase (NADP+)
MAGNGVVIKPSGHTPYTALALLELLLRAGLPARRVAVVCGGAATGQALVTDPRIALVSFTGGPATAARITAAAGPRKMLMELGGNNPTIVCADADLSTAAQAIVAGAFGVAGQNCLSVQRVYAHASAYPELVRLVARDTRKLTVGSKRDRGTDVGPLVDESAARRVEDCVDEALAGGACLHVGGTRLGAYYAPTVLTDVRPGARVLTEEIFGPVVTIASYDDLTDAVSAANDSDYALQAGLFTGNVTDAFATVAKLTCGAVVVNGSSDLRLDSMPFGGFKSSGIGREGVRYALEAMTEPKTTIVNLAS